MNFGIVTSKENKNEQEKVQKFFNRLCNKSVSKTVSSFLVGIFLFVIMILCIIPAQRFTSEVKDVPMLMPIILCAITYLLVNACVSPYNRYLENQKHRFIADITKYHPISKKVIWKLKIKIMINFLGKVTIVGLALQLIVSFIAYKSISWENFAYIIVFLFAIPVCSELLFDPIAKKVGLT